MSQIVTIKHDSINNFMSVSYDSINWSQREIGDNVEDNIRSLTLAVSDSVFEILQGSDYINQCHKLLNNK